MKNITFNWDPAKARSNLKKHNVSFEEAKSVFLDENAKLIDDLEHSIDEERFILLGLSYAFKLVLVCHCYRSQGNLIQIISARKASKTEATYYL